MNCSCCESFKTFAVIVVIIQLVFGVFRHTYEQFIKPALNGDNINFKKYGAWARKLYNVKVVKIVLWVVMKLFLVVTGATDGIGKEYARSVNIFS